MRPPYSALASIGSTARRWRYSATASPNKPRKRPPNVGTRTVRYGFSEGIALSRMSDGMRKKASWQSCAASVMPTSIRPAPQPTKADSATSQISSARTSARSVWGACSTASPSGRRWRGTGAWSAVREEFTALPASGLAGVPAMVESPGRADISDVHGSEVGRSNGSRLVKPSGNQSRAPLWSGAAAAFNRTVAVLLPAVIKKSVPVRTGAGWHPARQPGAGQLRASSGRSFRRWFGGGFRAAARARPWSRRGRPR